MVDGSILFLVEAEMNQYILWIGVILSAVYGVLTASAGLGQIKSRKIQLWSALGMIFCGLLVINAAVLALLRSNLALWVLIVGLLGTQGLTINNGFKLFGKINPVHHLARLVISVSLFGLTWMGLK